MSAHQFLITVDVEGWDAADSRTPEGYAAAALRCAGLPEAAQLDGYGDLSAVCDITDAEPLG